MSRKGSGQEGLPISGVIIGSPTSAPARRKVPADVLMEVASKISNREECTHLAGKLGFEVSDLIKWMRSSSSIEATAQEILLQWQARTTGTLEGMPSVLGRALLDINRTDLYNFLKRKCGYL